MHLSVFFLLFLSLFFFVFFLRYDDITLHPATTCLKTIPVTLCTCPPPTAATTFASSLVNIIHARQQPRAHDRHFVSHTCTRSFSVAACVLLLHCCEKATAVSPRRRTLPKPPNAKTISKVDSVGLLNFLVTDDQPDMQPEPCT